MEPIRRFLVGFVARDNRPGSVRSYSFALLRWWRRLRVVQVEWDRATSAEVRYELSGCVQLHVSSGLSSPGKERTGDPLWIHNARSLLFSPAPPPKHPSAFGG